MMGRGLILLLLALSSFSASADEWFEEGTCCDPVPVRTSPDFRPEPGNMGVNAFYFMYHVDDARIVGDQIIVDVSYLNSHDRWEPTNHAGVVRITVPFSEFASIEFTELLEKWKLNPDGMTHFVPESGKNSGMALGDFIAKVKFNIFKETEGRPSITLAGTIKSASGGFEEGRSTDSAGYKISALFAKDVLQASGSLRKIRIMWELGFLAWDDHMAYDGHSQDDSFVWGASAVFDFMKGFRATVGLNGYTGWHRKGVDKPVNLYIEGSKVITKNLEAFGGVDLGLNDSPTRYSLGVRIQIPRFYGKAKVLTPIN